jgi:hypothetical protein
VHSEWLEYEALKNKEMGGIFKVFAIGVAVDEGKNDYKDEKLIEFINEGK